MMDVRFSPQPWTRPTTPVGKRRRSPYRSTYTKTLEKLEYELAQLKATDILIECSFAHEQIRLDGWPRAGQRPRYNGVAVSFNQPSVGRVEYATDVCLNFEDNLHSIALGLEALRAVDRYGITAGQQQYTGFRAIGAGVIPMGGNGAMTRGTAAQFLVTHSGAAEEAIGPVLQNIEVAETLYRRAAKKLHPDQGGTAELFKELQDAMAVLRKPAA